MKEGAYQKQLILYLQHKSYDRAYDFSQEYVNAYPDDMTAHFLLAKSAMVLEKYTEAAREARLAFNYAHDPADMIMCVIHACIAYYRLKEYQKGFELLKSTESIRTCEETEQLFFLFSLATGDDKEARRHFDEMFRIDDAAAREFLSAVAEGVQVDYEKLSSKTDRFTN